MQYGLFHNLWRKQAFLYLQRQFSCRTLLIHFLQIDFPGISALGIALPSFRVNLIRLHSKIVSQKREEPRPSYNS